MHDSKTVPIYRDQLVQFNSTRDPRTISVSIGLLDSFILFLLPPNAVMCLFAFTGILVI